MKEARLNKDEKLLARIVNHSLLHGSFNPDLGLSEGRMGMVIFFFHYARYVENTLYEDFAGDFLEDIYEDITDETPVSCLGEIGWGILYLLQQGFVEGNTGEILEVLDRRIEIQHSYSSSDVIQRLMPSMHTEELSWRNGLKIIWDERTIHHK